MRYFLLCLLLTGLTGLAAQSPWYDQLPWTAADSLRGSLSESRAAYDVTYYHLDIELDIDRQSIENGKLQMDFRLLQPVEELQFDLFDNMTVDRVVLNQQELTDIRREHQAVFVRLPQGMTSGETVIHQMDIYYHGQPIAARNAPWDGGFVWERDIRERHWVGVACEGTGASLWWPNKDHLSEEPDSMQISVTVPERYFVASNGNLREIVDLPDSRQKRFDWFVSYPINNYNVSITVGHYAHFEDVYTSPFTGQELAMDYYVLDYNEERARKHFRQSQGVLEAFEYYFGPYPFPNDGFALIETPYLGMEHQSGIAYGNRYMRGYMGGMIPRDMNWDYIIVHETGHEYFGNSISVPDHAEMWIHESFTTYMEALYVEYHMDAESARRYLRNQRPYIRNAEPMLGILGVNFGHWQGSDHYYKGAWMLHSLRHALGSDERWWRILRGYYEAQQHRITDTETTIAYFAEAIGEDWVRPFFDQYLRRPELPTLEIERLSKKEIRYRWQAGVDDFAMPIDMQIGEEVVRWQPTTEWQTADVRQPTKLMVLPDRYLVDISLP